MLTSSFLCMTSTSEQRQASSLQVHGRTERTVGTLMKMLPTLERRTEGSRCDHMMRIGLPLSGW